MNSELQRMFREIPKPEGFILFPEAVLEGTHVDRFEEIVRTYPDNVAVTDGEEALTYRELNEAANQLAWTILEMVGPNPERVAFIAHQDIASVITIWGILKAGKTYITLDPAFSVQRMAKLVEALRISMLITTSSSYQASLQLHNRLNQITFLDSEAKITSNKKNPGIKISQDIPPYINHTSGTTGVPKIIGRHTRGLLDKEMVKTNTLGILPSDRYALANPLCYGASHLILFNGLLNGCTLCLYDIPKSGVGGFGRWLQDQKVTILFTTPPVFRNLFSAMPQGEQFNYVRLVIFTGDTMIAKDVELCNEHFSSECNLANILGLTEIGVVTLGIINRAVKHEGTIPVGFPLDGVEIRILDEEGKTLPAKQVGEIAIRMRNLTNYPIELLSLDTGKINPKMDMGFQKSGDLGKFLGDGSLQFLGRKDSMVKIRGLRVETTEVEARLHQYPRVRDASVFALQNPILKSPALVAYVVPADGERPTSKELRTFLSVYLPNYMIPGYFLFVEEIKLNKNGKVERKELPEPVWKKPESDVAYFPPHNRVEWGLVNIWQEVLGLERVGVHHEFAALGGESLQAVQILEKINAEWKIKLPLQSLVTFPTVALLAKHIREMNVEYEKTSIVAICEEGVSPALFMVPPGARTVMGTTRLAGGLVPGRRIYAVEYPGMEGYLEPMDSVEELATFFIQQIKRVQPQGPYHLTGQCMGGVVILEMAQQLIASGDEIGLLCPLDTNPPLPRKYFHKGIMRLLRSGQYDQVVRKIFSRFRNTRIVKTSTAKLQETNRKIRKEQQLDWLENPVDPESQRVLEKLDFAKNRYFPKVYPGHALLILSESARDTAKQEVWDVILPDKDLYYILDTSHRTIFMSGRSLKEIAGLINQHLPIQKGEGVR